MCTKGPCRSMPTSNDMEAGCLATRSIRKALQRAVQLTLREFKLPGLEIPSFDGTDCSQLRAQWNGYVKDCNESYRYKSEERRKVLAQLLKSGCRLFDGECRTCDPKLKGAEKEKWVEQMSVERPRNLCQGNREKWLHNLKESARELIAGWGRNLEECRGRDYIPDQQGCLEITSIEGGTMAVDEECFDSPVNHVRLGTAKTKGKIRVVTMQGAKVKRVLRPVHNALYSYLSSFGWLVRGDVGEADFEAIIRDKREGESFISGDYEQATNFICTDSVQAIVSVIAEDPHLSDEERKVLIGSFDNVTVVSRTGDLVCVVRNGSMMGNLVSFPLLCILNKCCYDISRRVEAYTGGFEYVDRVGRFNGDDCAFCGTDSFFQIWRDTTSRYGLVVQEQKTGISDRWIELNSESYDSEKHRFTTKAFLSYLRVTRDTPGDLLSEVISGTRGFSGGTKMWLINHVLRYDIAIRGLNASTIPGKLFRLLIKRTWFRKVLSSPLPPFPTTGIDRSIRQTVVSPPLPSFLPIIEELEKFARAKHIKQWVGVSAIDVDLKKSYDEMNPSSDLFRPLIMGPIGQQYISHSIPGMVAPMPLRSSLKGSLLRQRKIEFDRLPKPPSHIRYKREHSWAFTMSHLCHDALTGIFGHTWQMSPKSLRTSSLPYWHPSLKIRYDFVGVSTPTFFPPPPSLLSVKSLSEHAASIYGLPTRSRCILDASRVRKATVDSKLWLFVPPTYLGSAPIW
ncbi:RNA-dependent RNA polymerase [Botrytis cinerea ourmia-like virus 4]|uniref:RNA-dependent RNA polymerase n=1 Tax=Botrytis cinerea ourmia-like virus 4 TaxID=2735954 RepID=A0ABX6NZ63_9VIRU|nr:RNA-dependent RNA polymerase [Botrytis cinerea ourmia-like virus 4]QJT73670.1 RNA-dependent RNA polymerase [Botrytis cinerea ourmia-like virus 4]